MHTKCGLVLRGRGKDNGDAKNRRTTFFSSCGIPLVMNYQPHEIVPFIANKDYVYIKSPDELCHLETVDPKPFAQRSRELYVAALSPTANANYIIKTILSDISQGDK
jgi:hypothetical protein